MMILAPLFILLLGGISWLPFVIVHGPEVAIAIGPQMLFGIASGLAVVWFAGLYLRERAGRLELERERLNHLAQSRQEALQNTTLTLAEKLTAENARLLQWIQRKEMRGESVPKAVRSAAETIGQTLSELSSAAFVRPYEVTAAMSKAAALRDSSEAKRCPSLGGC